MEQAIHGKTAGGQANPLGEEKIGKLLRQFAVPSIIAMLVSAVYNIVDQFFIGQSVGCLLYTSYALLQGQNIFDACVFATRCSAVTVCRPGAQESMPTLADLSQE